MINYIICDDNLVCLKTVQKIISNVMMENDVDYSIHSFNDYNKKFYEIIDKKLSNKIYILDIETPTSSGIDVARKIRSVDYNSTIIFLSCHEELGYKLLQKDFLFLTFINKYDDYENNLFRAIKTSLKKINCTPMLKYNKNGLIYMIPHDDILYIVRDSIERKSIIKTDYLEFMISKNLNEIKKDLSSDFIYSHRSCIVNKKRIRFADIHNRIIKFDNKDSIDFVSNIFKKEYEKK